MQKKKKRKKKENKENKKKKDKKRKMTKIFQKELCGKYKYERGSSTSRYKIISVKLTRFWNQLIKQIYLIPRSDSGSEWIWK